MDELQTFRRSAQRSLGGGVAVAAAATLAIGHPEIALGIVAGGLVGFVNLAALTGAIRCLSEAPFTTRTLQLGGMLRLLLMAGLLGAVMIAGKAHPVGAVIGYGLFPLAAAAGGFCALRGQPRSRA